MGSILGRFGGSERRSGGVRGRSGEAASGRKKKKHFKKFKIMKLCQNLNLLLKRMGIDLNHFFDGLFF